MRILVILLVTFVVSSNGNAEVLTGVVLKENGSPAPGATITAAQIFKKPPLRLMTKANDQGVFRIDLPKIDDAQRFMLAIRWNLQGADVSQTLDHAGQQTDILGQALPPITVRLRKQGELKGRLLQTEDDQPIIGARLFLDAGEVLTTNERGEFHVDGLPMKDHSLIPVAPGRVRSYILFDTTQRPNAELELRLPRGAVIKGKITDTHGKAIPDAYLTRASSGTALTLNGWDEVCQPDGSFEYGGLSSNRLFYGLEAHAPGYVVKEIATEVKNPTEVIVNDIQLTKQPGESRGTSQVEITSKAPQEPVVLPRKTVHGSVLNKTGVPVSGAEVRWGMFPWDQSVKSTRTDKAGRFALANVPLGPGAILVIADGYAPQFAALKKNDAPPGSLLDVVLSRGVSVRGIVRGTIGNPVSGVSVTAVTICFEKGSCDRTWLTERSAVTNEDGEFEIDSVSGNFRFDILKDGYSEQRSVGLNMDGSINEIQLQSGGAIGGTIANLSGRNFNIRVRIPRERHPDENIGGYYAGFDWYGITFTRDDGTFIFTDLGADHLMRLIVRSPGIGFAILDRVKSQTLDQLSPLDSTTISLKPFVPLTVQVLDADTKKPLPDALVAILEDEPDFSRGFSWGYHDLWATRVRCDATGIARFSEPACVDGTVIVRTPGFARQRIAWIDGAEKITVELQPAAVLSGAVRLQGSPVNDGFVRLKSQDNDSHMVNLSDKNGGFEFGQLSAGDYEISVDDSSGQELHRERLTLKPKDKRSITIEISKSLDRENRVE